jgi:hypothetical protein
VKGNHSHVVFFETPLHVNTVRDMSKLPWYKYLKGQESKNNQPLNPSASHEILDRTYDRTMYLPRCKASVTEGGKKRRVEVIF